MSRIGKKPIELNGATIETQGHVVNVKGAKGELTLDIPDHITIEIKEGKLIVTPVSEGREARAQWGLWRSLLANAVHGVTTGFTRELELVGVGYRVQKKGEGLELAVGYSHKVDFLPPAGVELNIENGLIKVTGIDKQKVGQTAANIRRVRPPEPYQGKGIRYAGEQITLKPGKAAKASGG
ncbi:50S ribosomal protein L6 [candidate division WWE3 bacterium]|nr:50S ribosomal protein L6 [candidate division WWE3 bacterium]